MVINKKLRSGDSKIDEYIESLESEILRKNTSSIDKFIKASDKIASVLADDLSALADGRQEDCQILKSENSDKTVERIFLMLKNSTLFNEIASIADTLSPEVVNEAQDLKVDIDETGNAFEQMQRRIRDKSKS